jgi:hypothetical protein
VQFRGFFVPEIGEFRQIIASCVFESENNTFVEIISNLWAVACVYSMTIGTLIAILTSMHKNIMNILKPISVVALVTMVSPAIVSAEKFTREVSREFSADSIQKVDIQAYSADVTVTGHDQAVVTITVELTAKASNQEAADEIFNETEVSFEEEEGVLEAVIKTKGRKSRSWFGFMHTSTAAKANISVTLPETMDLNLKTGSGDVSVEDLTGVLAFNSGSGSVEGSNLMGELKATTGSGEVDLEDVEGTVVARTGSGNIRINDMEGNLDASTGSGGLNVSGKITQFGVKTGSGNVRVESSVQLLENSKAATGSGGVTIELPESSGFVLSASVGSGSISCDFDLVDPVQKKRSLKGATAAEGPKLSIGTGSGGIDVRFN